jgi:hypothetical protein
MTEASPSPPLAEGEVVVFTPDEDTTRRYARAFVPTGIYPGYVGMVVRRTGDLLRVGETRKAWPASQFRRAADFSPEALGAYRARAEAAWYASRGPVPYRPGDAVRFTPSAYCALAHEAEWRAAGLYPTRSGTVTALRDESVEIDHLGVFYHWSEFTRQA